MIFKKQQKLDSPDSKVDDQLVTTNHIDEASSIDLTQDNLENSSLKKMNAKDLKNKKKSKNILFLVFGTAIAIVVGTTVYTLKSNKEVKNNSDQKSEQVIEKKEIIYKTTLDNSIKTKDQELEVAYPFGLYNQVNTAFYAYNIITNLDIISIDPLGEAFPAESQKLSNLPSVNLGNANLAVNLDSLPKQSYLIKLITKSGDELLTTQHYYLSNNPFDRTIRLSNLKAGAYYIQALNLVTHSSYISSPFYLNSSGEIVSGQDIGFERIDTENIFGLPETNEITPLGIDDIPIVLNERYTKYNVEPESSPFEKTQ